MKGPMPHDAFQAEDDHRTLTRAAEIQADKRRMSGARRQHTKQTKTLEKVGQQMLGMHRKMTSSRRMTGGRR